MKRKYLHVVCVLIASVILISSCHKSTDSNGGNWIFKSKSFHANFCSYILGALTASTGTADPSGSLAFYFYDSTSNATIQYIYSNDTPHVFIPRVNFTFPPKLQSYTVTNTFPPDSGYVYVQLTDTSISNSYVASGSTAPTVTVTTNSQGYLVVTLPPVMMVNINSALPPVGHPSGTDSSLVSGSIIQTKIK